MNNVYYNSEINAWMRTGSNKIYPTKEKAERAAAISEKARARYYERLEKLELDYSLIYNRYISASDRPNTGSSGFSDPDGEMIGGTEKGRGFFRLFIKNNFSDRIPLGDVIDDAKSSPEIANFLRATLINYSDPVIRTALERLMSRADLL